MRKLGVLVWMAATGMIPAMAQDFQEAPLIVVGDSGVADPNSLVIITGRIFSGPDKEPVSSATVSADFFKYFDYADQYGRYYLAMPPGQYNMIVRHLGFSPAYFRLTVKSGGLMNIELQEGAFDLEEVVISSRPIDSNIKGSLSGLTTLGMNEIKALPALLGEVDLVRSLQLMPGVSSQGEGASGINVRGGRTDQNLMLLNGVPIFNASHAFGFISSFNQDIVRDFSLYKGNVPGQYGGRAASVLEINTRRGDFSEWQAQLGIGPITARATVEGPIRKDTTSLLLSGRLAFPGWMLRIADDPNVSTSKSNFGDAYASLSHRFSPASSADFSCYYSQDGFTYSSQFGFDWSNLVAQADYRFRADRKASPGIGLAFGSYKSKLADPSGPDASQLTTGMNYLQFKPQVSYTPDEKHSIAAGAEAIAYFTKPQELSGYQGNSAIVSRTVSQDKGVELSAFVNDEFEISERWALSAGMRYSHYVQLGTDTVYSYSENAPRALSTIVDTSYYGPGEVIAGYGGLEPRVSARFSINGQTSLKASYNRMRQYLHQVSNFSTPTPVDIWQMSTPYLKPQIADNYSIGYYINTRENRSEVSFELFYKKITNLIDYKDFPELFLTPHIETELVSGRGRTYGGEFYARKLKGYVTGWISYTYTHSEVRIDSSALAEGINGGNWYPPGYNRPHALNLVVNRALRNKGTLSMIVQYQSGRPVTGIETSYPTNGTVVPVYSTRNKYTTPYYLRFDVSLTIGSVFRRVEDSLVLSIYNLFGRDNAYSVFYQRPWINYYVPKPYQLSIVGVALPSITYAIRFR